MRTAKCLHRKWKNVALTVTNTHTLRRTHIYTNANLHEQIWYSSDVKYRITNTVASHVKRTERLNIKAKNAYIKLRDFGERGRKGIPFFSISIFVHHFIENALTLNFVSLLLPNRSWIFDAQHWSFQRNKTTLLVYTLYGDSYNFYCVSHSKYVALSNAMILLWI